MALPPRPENPKPRYMPREAIVALRALAEPYGGIGHGPERAHDWDRHDWLIPENDRARGKPISAVGMLIFALGDAKEARDIAFRARLFDDEASNFAPRRIMERLGLKYGTKNDRWPRFPMDEWMAELNIMEKPENG